MNITITLDTDLLNQHDVNILHAVAGFYESHAAANPQPQPEVGDNTGTSSTGIILSPGAAGVSEPAGSDAAGSAPDTNPAAEAPARRGRKPKETAAAPVGESAPAAAEQATSAPAPTAAPVAAQAAADAKPLTIDDVRAKLQAFTGAKGIDAGLALLGEFKAGRISELKAEDYPAFVAKCEVAA